MKTQAELSNRLFPCPVCGEGLPVHETKRHKPCVTCNFCGVQLFVRMKAGIEKFERLVADAQANSVWERLKTLEIRYLRKCPECGKEFWINEKAIATSWFDGRVIGYKCPEPDCDGIVKLSEEK